MPEVIAAGHVSLDIIPRILKGGNTALGWLTPGRLTETGEAVLATGGSAPNTGIALHRLGADVSLVVRLGDDLLGGVVLQIIAAADPGLTERVVIAQGESSPYTIVISPPGVDRCFLHYPGTNNTFGPEDLTADLLTEARLLHFGYPPLMRRMFTRAGSELAELFRRAKAAGLTTSLDLAMPDPARPSGQADWEEILARTLPYVDIFVPSVEELLFMLDRASFDALARAAGAAPLLDLVTPEMISALGAKVIALGAQVALIKLGHRGVYLRTGVLARDLGRGAPSGLERWRLRELWAPAFRVDVVGTVGAGDCTIAGLLMAVLRGCAPEDALRIAAAVGACNVEAADATSGVQTWEATLARLAAPWPHLEPHIASQAWRHDPASGIWHGPADRA